MYYTLLGTRGLKLICSALCSAMVKLRQVYRNEFSLNYDRIMFTLKLIYTL
jgi:hypothetical protein